MAGPVWLLSVDLQTKTATFTTGLADAAKGARGAFQDIKGGADEMGGRVNYSMMEARHGVMLLGEEFGVHLPRALTSFIASIGPVGAALEAAFPFLAIAVGATLLLEKLSHMHEAGEKLSEDQTRFETAANNAFNTLEQKLIQAEIKSDELKNDHLGALALQLKLIDQQSMAELVKSFDEVAKAAEPVMKELEGSWYKFGIGSAGAKHALVEFQVEYANLLSKGDLTGASDKLHGTLDEAQKTLDMMHQLQANRSGDGQKGDYQKAEQAAEFLRQRSLLSKVTGDFTKAELDSQVMLVAALRDQVNNEKEIAAVKKVDTGNAVNTEGNQEAARAATAGRQAAESKMRLSEMVLAADKATAESGLNIQRASLEERLAAEIEFANRDRDVKLEANRAEIAALDKNGKDYANQLKALQDKTLEIQQENVSKVAELTAKNAVEVNSRDLRELEQSERAKVEATRQGSAARLAAIDAAIKEEEAHNLQDTNYYRELLNQRVEVSRQMGEEEGKLRAEAGKEEAENELKSGEMILAAHREAVALEESLRRESLARRMSDAIRASDMEYTLKQADLEKKKAALDKEAKDYENKLKAIQDQEKQLAQQHEDDLTNIKVQAETARNQRVLASFTQFEESIASGLTQSIMRHQTWAQMITSLGDQVVSGMIKNALMSMMTLDMDKERQAAAAARQFFNAGAHLPFPVNLVAAPVLAAGAFAAVMAFEDGTDQVPGVGRHDVTPAMLTPGEGIVPGGVMDGLRNMAHDGGFSKAPQYHVHVRPTYHVNTIDGDGMQAALEKHADQLQRHFENSVRRMNR